MTDNDSRENEGEMGRLIKWVVGATIVIAAFSHFLVSLPWLSAFIVGGILAVMGGVIAAFNSNLLTPKTAKQERIAAWIAIVVVVPIVILAIIGTILRHGCGMR